MNDGFVRCAAVTPKTRVADVEFNCKEMITATKEAAKNGCAVVLFPELSITGYTCGDLFLQRSLQNKAFDGLKSMAAALSDENIVAVVGLPYSYENRLYNVAAVISGGRIAGLVPKTNIPNYSEFYERRHFSPFKGDFSYTDDGIPFGRMVFECANDSSFTFGIEICEDLWVPAPPSVRLALSGASIILNPSASDEVIGKADYRRKLVSMQSASLICGYVYCDCGFGESTQDLVFSGHNLICENGSILSESKLFSSEMVFNDIDLEKLAFERMRIKTFNEDFSDDDRVQRVYFDYQPEVITNLVRKFPKYPFVPSSKEDLDNRCNEILTMQATGLATRLKHINCSKVVIGVSGGLDSTLALIVAVHAFDILGISRKGILSVTMPGFGTTSRTKNNSLKLAEAYGATLTEISIAKSVMQHFEDISQDPNNHDVTYENGQARERTQILMDLSNKNGAIVIGTGDLSELALGWATYNGDHMSMYGVNASIPKTLVKYLVKYEALRLSEVDEALSSVLYDIVDTPVSPELLPPTEDGKISQKTEELVGPYDLHDFFLYYTVRLGFTPSKIFRLACLSFEGEFDAKFIYKWEYTFFRRFFAQQFKRSCLPDCPKVGTVTLSPRGDWRMPSDASVSLWLEDLEKVNPSK